jgi:hypothetical protein
MKSKKTILALGLLLLCLTPLSLMAGSKLALMPSSGTVYTTGGPVTSLKFDAFCNATPCNLTWIAILSTDGVGTIDNATGPTTTFTSGGIPGTALVIVRDDQGHMGFATVNVVQAH